jgi:hypothetical protein
MGTGADDWEDPDDEEIGEPDSPDFVEPVAPWHTYDRKYRVPLIPFYEDPRYEVDVLKALRKTVDLSWEDMACLATRRLLSFRDIIDVIVGRMGRVNESAAIFNVPRSSLENWTRKSRSSRPECCRDARHICEERLGIKFRDWFFQRDLSFVHCGLSTEAFALSRGPVNRATVLGLLEIKMKAEELKVREEVRSALGQEPTDKHWADLYQRTFRKH